MPNNLSTDGCITEDGLFIGIELVCIVLSLPQQHP